jgi:hypothetical protein
VYIYIMSTRNLSTRRKRNAKHARKRKRTKNKKGGGLFRKKKKGNEKSLVQLQGMKVQLEEAKGNKKTKKKRRKTTGRPINKANKLIADAETVTSDPVRLMPEIPLAEEKELERELEELMAEPGPGSLREQDTGPTEPTRSPPMRDAAFRPVLPVGQLPDPWQKGAEMGLKDKLDNAQLNKEKDEELAKRLRDLDVKEQGDLAEQEKGKRMMGRDTGQVDRQLGIAKQRKKRIDILKKLHELEERRKESNIKLKAIREQGLGNTAPAWDQEQMIVKSDREIKNLQDEINTIDGNINEMATQFKLLVNGIGSGFPFLVTVNASNDDELLQGVKDHIANRHSLTEEERRKLSKFDKLLYWDTEWEDWVAIDDLRDLGKKAIVCLCPKRNKDGSESKGSECCPDRSRAGGGGNKRRKKRKSTKRKTTRKRNKRKNNKKRKYTKKRK